MADWLEIWLEVTGEGAEAAADVLRRYAHQGVAIENRFPSDAWEDEPVPQDHLVVRAYIPIDAEVDAKRRQIEEALYYLSRIDPHIPPPSFRTVREEDWAEAWKQHYHPIRVGSRLLIKPAWLEVQAGPEDIVIELDPGMAFGTGTHPTTQLCLQACEWLVRPDTLMLDLGTGSGILAIAAAKLGARRIIARDIDEVAVRMTQDNARRNGVANRVVAQHGSLEGLLSSPRRFDLGMANITANIIRELASQGLQHLIRPGGAFVFSGILREQADDVAAVLASIGLVERDRREQGDWVLLITRRQE